MSILFRKLGHSSVKNVVIRFNEAPVFVLSCRKLSLVPNVYGDPDPAPKFFSPNVQVLLKRLTRPDFDKVFRKRTNSNSPILRTPTYKFLTNEELEVEMAKAHEKADRLLQIPPAVKARKPINEVLSTDPALIGYDSATYLFTDITFGVDNEHRIIVQRDPDGTLRNCDHDTRKKLNQVYFPVNGRKLREPKMFTDEDKLYSLLDREEYEFVLDRACLQYEPDEPSYQRITSITYQHIDAMKKYDLLRSSRHFGALTFYLCYHRGADALALALLQAAAPRDLVLLAAVLQHVHGDLACGPEAVALSQEILKTPLQLTKPERLTDEDIKLDNKCVECIEKYIKSTSSMKSQQELALQGFREHYQQLVELSAGLQKAHGL